LVEVALRRAEEQRRRDQNARRADEQLAVNFDQVLNAAAVDERGVWTTQRIDRKKKRQLLRRGLQKNDLMTPDEVRYSK